MPSVDIDMQEPGSPLASTASDKEVGIELTEAVVWTTSKIPESDMLAKARNGLKRVLHHCFEYTPLLIAMVCFISLPSDITKGIHAFPTIYNPAATEAQLNGDRGLAMYYVFGNQQFPSTGTFWRDYQSVSYSGGVYSTSALPQVCTNNTFPAGWVSDFDGSNTQLCLRRSENVCGGTGAMEVSIQCNGFEEDTVPKLVEWSHVAICIFGLIDAIIIECWCRNGHPFGTLRYYHQMVMSRRRLSFQRYLKALSVLSSLAYM